MAAVLEARRTAVASESGVVLVQSAAPTSLAVPLRFRASQVETGSEKNSPRRRYGLLPALLLTPLQHTAYRLRQGLY